MLPPDLQIYFRPPLPLTFDLMTPEADRFMPLPGDHLRQLALKLVLSLSKYRVYKFADKRTDGQTDGQTDGRTDGQVENTVPPPASLAWRRHKIV